jgi:hypothetical protein
MNILSLLIFILCCGHNHSSFSMDDEKLGVCKHTFQVCVESSLVGTLDVPIECDYFVLRDKLKSKIFSVHKEERPFNYAIILANRSKSGFVGVCQTDEIYLTPETTPAVFCEGSTHLLFNKYLHLVAKHQKLTRIGGEKFPVILPLDEHFTLEELNNKVRRVVGDFDFLTYKEEKGKIFLQNADSTRSGLWQEHLTYINEDGQECVSILGEEVVLKIPTRHIDIVLTPDLTHLVSIRGFLEPKRKI